MSHASGSVPRLPARVSGEREATYAGLTVYCDWHIWCDVGTVVRVFLLVRGQMPLTALCQSGKPQGKKSRKQFRLVPNAVKEGHRRHNVSDDRDESASTTTESSSAGGGEQEDKVVIGIVNFSVASFTPIVSDYSLSANIISDDSIGGGWVGDDVGGDGHCSMQCCVVYVTCTSLCCVSHLYKSVLAMCCV